MGVNGSLSLSLIIDGRLWGMIICHHPSPLHVPAARRLSCSLIADALGLSISLGLAVESRDTTKTARRIMGALLGRHPATHTWQQRVIEERSEFCRLFEADEFMLIDRFRVRYAGAEISQECAGSLARYVTSLDAGTIWTTDCLSGHHASAHMWQNWAAGICCVCLGIGTTVVLLRKASPQSIQWSHSSTDFAPAGAGHGDRVPQYNFEPWVERRTQWSKPWTVDELAFAEALLDTLQSMNLVSSLSRSSDDEFVVASDGLVGASVAAQSFDVHEQDALTGLANRAAFTRRLSSLCAVSSDTSPGQFALLLIDADNLKITNDTFGHAAGDELLAHIAQALRHCGGPQDLPARIGGDEFAFIVENRALIDNIDAFAARLVDEVRSDAERRRFTFGASISIGVVVPDQSRPHGALLKQADWALYEAKSRGKNSFVIFDEQLAQAMRDRLRMEQRLIGASYENCIVLYAQRQVSLKADARFDRYEMLARWDDHNEGHLLPELFLNAVERIGKMGELTRVVLEKTMATIGGLASDQSPCLFAINVAASDLYDFDFFEQLERAAASGVFGEHRLELEVTERAFFNVTPAVLKRLERLKVLGIGLALDDFGTGFSSIEHLRNLPIDTVKIDRSFTQEMNTEAGLRLMQGIVALLRARGTTIVAEGVETWEQVDALMGLGCDFAQGYVYHRPELLSPASFSPGVASRRSH